MRWNPDEKLRRLEREHQASPTAEGLLRLNQLRARAGLKALEKCGYYSCYRPARGWPFRLCETCAGGEYGVSSPRSNPDSLPIGECFPWALREQANFFKANPDSRFRTLQRRYALTGDVQDLDLLLQEHYRAGVVVNFDATNSCEEIQRILNRPIAESLQITFADIQPREMVRAVYTRAENDTARLESIAAYFPPEPPANSPDFHLRALGVLLNDLSMGSSVWACIWQSQDHNFFHCRGMLIHRQPVLHERVKYSIIAMTQLLEGTYNVDHALAIHGLTERATRELTGFVHRISNRPVKITGQSIVSEEICWLPAWLS